MFTRGVLAERAGVNSETIRFYENKGLLPEPSRNESGYRMYSDEDLRKVVFIQRAKDLGFTLREVAELLQMRVSPRGGCAGVKRKAELKIADIEAKIRDLNRMKKSLSGLRDACASRSPTGDCPIIESLNRT